MATSSGLSLWRPNLATMPNMGISELFKPHRPDQCDGGWLALLPLPSLPSRSVSPSEPHYVLVLDVNNREVLVADPHAGRELLLTMAVQDFELAWLAARGPKMRPWAGYLSRLSPG